jgi:uncharacterized protein involved in response to NO
MRTLWSVYTAAPHRVLFLPGAIQGVIAMLWWLLDLETRLAGGEGLVSVGLPAAVLHGWLMVFGFFPFFVFGFLFTAAPNWLSGPGISRSAYGLTALGLSVGTVLLYLGQSGLGMLMHLLGWSVALQALLATLLGGKDSDKRHAWATWVALALGAAAELLMLAGLIFEHWDWLQAGLELGVWACLTPLFLTVSHRMIPWFTSRVISNYVIIRPYPLLWALSTGCLIHAALTLTGQAGLTWLVDLPMAAMAFWCSSRWGFMRALKVRLLAMLHIAFLWAGAAFALYGVASLASFIDLEWSAGLAPLHALGIGFFSAMLIGMASRVSLGHSGRALQADALTWSIFWSVQVVALLRILPDISADLVPGRWVSLAGLLWLVAFSGWAWRYAPMSWRPRVDGKKG